MNYKLEKFWNAKVNFYAEDNSLWTINLKSFEIWTGGPAPIGYIYEL